MSRLKQKTFECQQSPCSPKLAVLWFWTTVLATYFCGTYHVLPTIYHNDWLLTFKRLLGTFLLLEMVANWFCLHLIDSRYRPIPFELGDLTNRIGGFEIDLDQLKTRVTDESKRKETYSLPLSSIRPIGKNPCSRWNHDTMYLVSIQTDEACFVTSNKTLSQSPRGEICLNPSNKKHNGRCENDDDDDDDLNCNQIQSRPLEVNRGGYDEETKNGVNKRFHLRKFDGPENFGNNQSHGKEPDGEINWLDKMEEEDEEKEIQDGLKNHEGRHVVVYPYWSWKPCKLCNLVRPPRAHHCRLCGHCVLKRDHHCFFAATCVGLRNQRHFIVFLFWSSIAIVFSLFQASAYIIVRCFYSVGVDTLQCLGDVILPVTVYRLFRGLTSMSDFVLVLLLYSLLWFLLVCCGFFVEQLRLVLLDCTSFERENSIRVVKKRKTAFSSLIGSESSFAFKSFPGDDCDDYRSESKPFQICVGGKGASSKVRLRLERWNRSLYWVFGRNWLLNFIVPLHFVYETPEDGITWKSVSHGDWSVYDNLPVA